MSAELITPHPGISPTQTKSPSEYLAVVKRRKKSMLITAGIMFLLAVVAALFWPAIYRSSATILIEEQEIPQDMVRSTITSYANQQIQVITQRVMTAKNIMVMVEKLELYTSEQLAQMPRMAVVNSVRNAIVLDVVSADVLDPRSGRPSQATIAFSLSFKGRDPRKAQQAVNELVSLYLNENLLTRTEKTKSTEAFLRQEADVLNAELDILEEQLAEFKRQNKDALPDSFQYNVQNLARLETQISNAQSRLRETSKLETELVAQLAQTSAYAPMMLATGETVLADVDRLKALQSEYRKKAASYNSNHPDIKKLRREIDTLSATVGHAGDKGDLERLLMDRKAELEILQDKYAPDHPDVVSKKRLIEQLDAQLVLSGSGDPAVRPDNPPYIYLRNQINALRAERTGLHDETSSLVRQAEQLKQALIMAPGVEKEYVKMHRKLKTTQEKYHDLKLKLRDAELAGALEQGLKGQRFTLIEPANLPEDPVSPNRQAMVLIGIIMACAASCGMAIMLEILDQSLRTEKSLIAVTGSPPLATIPYIKSPSEQEKSRPNRRLLIFFVSAGFLLLIVALLSINYLYKPLEVLWYVVLRQLGLD